MNRVEFRNAVAERNGLNAQSSAQASSTSIDAAVRQGLWDVANVRRWEWLLTGIVIDFGVPPNPIAPIPPATIATKALFIGGKKVRYLELEELYTRQEPFTWSVEGQFIRVFPAPTVALPSPVLFIYRTEPELVTDVQLPLMPMAWDQVVIARASYHLNMRRKELERAALDDTEYQEGLRRMVNHRTIRPTMRNFYSGGESYATWR